MAALNFFQKLTCKITLVLAIMLTAYADYAQVSSPPGDPAGDPDPVPIQGILYLLIGGLIIGVKKIVGTHKQKK
jgi:hypothetical protein